MNRPWFRLLLVGAALAALIAVPAARVAAAEIPSNALGQELGALSIESLFQELLDSNIATPVYTDYGDGLHSLSIALTPEIRERLLAATNAGDFAKKPQTFFVLSTGQQLTSPADPGICIHASLSLANASYNYWVVALNLGTKNVTATTTLKLSGPGLKFNKSAQILYGAGGIWIVWYNPGAGVGQSGLYTLQSSVAGASGSATSKSFAVFP